MDVKITIPYKSHNHIYLYMVRDIAREVGVYGYVMKGETLKILISGEEDRIKMFFEMLGYRLPLSIFMDEAKIDILNNPESIEKRFEIKNNLLNILPLNQGMCPSCFEEFKNKNGRRYLYPFISCKYCGNQYNHLFSYPFERENTIFRYFTMCDDCKKEFSTKYSSRENFPLTSCYNCFIPISLQEREREIIALNGETLEHIYRYIAKKIDDGEEVIIKTMNGYRRLSKYFKKGSFLLFLNHDNIYKYVYASKEDLKALGSIEKPLLKLILREDFKARENIGLNFLFAKLSDDPILTGISIFLNERNFDYLFVENIPEGDVKFPTLDFNLRIENPQKDLKLAIIQGEKVFISGERGLFPMVIRSQIDKQCLTLHDSLGCLNIGEGEYILDRCDKVRSINQELKSRRKEIKINEIEAFKLAINSVILENNLIDEEGSFVFISYDFPSVIGIKKGKELTPLIHLYPIKKFLTIEQTLYNLLQELSTKSEDYRKLTDRFLSKFEITLSKPEDNPSLSENMRDFFEIVAKILGISLDDGEPFEVIESLAIGFKSDRGVVVDFVLLEEGGKFFIDWQKAVASLMAYRIAGSDNNLLSYSLLESFANFIERQVDVISKKFSTDKILISGDMLGNSILSGRLFKHLKRFRLYKNRVLPVGKENFVFGGVLAD